MQSRIAILCVGLPFAGCAYVPEIESESTFSYAEIMNQAECELYWAGENLWKQPQDDSQESQKFAFPEFQPERYSVEIDIAPWQKFSSSANLGGQFKTSTKGVNYFQWVLGTSNGSAGATGDSAFGKASGTNQYLLNTQNLYEQIEIDPKTKNGMISIDLYNGKQQSKFVITSYYSKEERATLPNSGYLPDKMPKTVHHYAETGAGPDDKTVDHRDYDAWVDPSPYDPKSDTRDSYGTEFFYIVIYDSGNKDHSIFSKDYVRPEHDVLDNLHIRNYRAINFKLSNQWSPLQNGLTRDSLRHSEDVSRRCRAVTSANLRSPTLS